MNRALPAHRGLPGLLAATVAVAAAACSPGSADEDAGDERLAVLASFYPLQFVAEEVGGADVRVSSLTPPGAEPHDLELSPAQVRGVGEADVVLLLGGLQPAVDEAVAARRPARVLDAADVVDLLPAQEEAHADEPHADEAGAEIHEEGDGDPHFWLDPSRLAAYAAHVADALSEARPESADAFTARAADLSDRLGVLDAEFERGLERCESRAIVTAHDAFGYLADRYDLEHVAISGLEPESEPSPARLREVAAAVEDEAVTTIFYETLVSPKVAEVLAGDLGVGTAVLDPVEGLVDEDADYLSVMRANLDGLRAALRCA